MTMTMTMPTVNYINRTRYLPTKKKPLKMKKNVTLMRGRRDRKIGTNNKRGGGMFDYFKNMVSTQPVQQNLDKNKQIKQNIDNIKNEIYNIEKLLNS